jgi:hypothetical protein
VREELAKLGDLTADFDFSQPPLRPVLLPVQPLTDLFAPAPRPRRGVRVPGIGLVPPYGLRAAARALAMTPRQLRRELASGKTLAQIAREHGHTYAQVRRAIVRRLRGQIVP